MIKIRKNRGNIFFFFSFLEIDNIDTLLSRVSGFVNESTVNEMYF